MTALATYQPREMALGEHPVAYRRDEMDRYQAWLDEQAEQYTYTLGPGYPASTNVFIPDFQRSGKMIIGYSRNPRAFQLPQYVQYVKSDLSVGLYLKMSFQEQARVVSVQEFEWPDNQVRPMHDDGLEQFNFQEYRTHRYDYGWTTGYMTRNQADWPLVDHQQAIKAQQMMTARTIRMWTVLTTAANWTVAGTGSAGSGTEFDMTADHTATAATLAGGYLDQGTSTSPFLRIAFDKAEVAINLDTTGVVDRKQLLCVINPDVARLLSESPEIHEYIKGSYWAQEEIRQMLDPNNKFGLPSTVYGMRIVVDTCVKATSRKGGTLVKTYAVPDQTVMILSRVGELEGVARAPSFTTATIFWFEDEMTVELFDDPKNRLTEGHIVENTAEVLTSPVSGYYITSATSVAS